MDGTLKKKSHETTNRNVANLRSFCLQDSYNIKQITACIYC